MLSRFTKPRSPSRSVSKKAVSATDGVDSLIGDTGVSLDGVSLRLPDGASRDEGSLRDESSSINTSNHGGQSRPMKSFQVVNDGDEPSMLGDEPSITAGVLPPPAPPAPLHPKVISTDSSGDGVLPKWMKTAPPYFKVFIILSLALMVGAIVLVIVAAALSGGDSGGGSTDEIEDLSFPPSPVAAPTEVPSASSPPSEPTPGTPAPTPDLADDVVTFYVTAGRFQGDSLDQLPERLAALPDVDESSFLVHLGDWNSPFATNCTEDSYQRVHNLYNTSNVPVFFCVGDNEYNDCPEPVEAMAFWYDYLLEYESEYWPESPEYDVRRQWDDMYPENFAFFFKGILFVGINLVGGLVHDDDEWEERMEFDLTWIDDNVASFPDAETLIVFAHADPDIRATSPFFEGFYEKVDDDYDMIVKFIHRNLGVETSRVEEVDGIGNLELVVVEGQLWPPMRVRISASGDVFDADQGDWYDEEVGGD